MKRQNDMYYLPLFASSPYYRKKDFQFPITAVPKTITSTTALKNNSGITIIYCRQGRGNIIANMRTYPIHRGFLLVLGAYHYYQISPVSESLELTQCRLSYDSFLYMAANPYYKLTELTLNVDPLVSLLDGEMLERTERLLEELSAVTAKHKKRGGETEFFLCMKLMGILQKTYRKDIWSADDT